MEAEVLVWANLRGIDSHGVQRVGEYAARVDQGVMNPRPDIRAERVREGIPLPPGTEAKLIAAADRFGLELPARHR